MSGRVDAHHHIWDLSVREQSWMVGPELDPIRRNFSIDDLAPRGGRRRDRDRPGPDGQRGRLRPPSSSIFRSNDLVAGVVGWVDLTAPDVADALAGLRERPDGVSEGDPAPGARRAGRATGLPSRRTTRAAAVADAGLVYDLLTKTPHLPAAIDTALPCRS